MGRPKGSKNKPKVPQVVETTKIEKKAAAVKEPPKAAKVEADTRHVFIQFLDYVKERMDGKEMEYYRKFAKKMDRSVDYAIAKSLVDFFRVHDLQLDISKL